MIQQFLRILSSHRISVLLIPFIYFTHLLPSVCPLYLRVWFYVVVCISLSLLIHLFYFLNSTDKWNHMTFVFLLLIYFTWHYTSRHIYVVGNGKVSFHFLWLSNIPLYTCIYVYYLFFFLNLFFIGVQFTNIQNNPQCPSPIHSHLVLCLTTVVRMDIRVVFLTLSEKLCFLLRMILAVGYW